MQAILRCIPIPSPRLSNRLIMVINVLSIVSATIQLQFDSTVGDNYNSTVCDNYNIIG